MTDSFSVHHSNTGQDITRSSSIFSGASPKLTFIMGLVVGVAAISVIAVVLAVLYGFPNKWLAEAQPSNTYASALPSGSTAPSGSQPASPSAKVNIAIKPGDYIRGNKSA